VLCSDGANAWARCTSITGSFDIGDGSDGTVAVTDGNGILKPSSSGVLMDDATPDAAGEFGYSSGKFGFYGANSEDLYIEPGNASNSAVIGTNTGVTSLSFSAINLVTTGTISGLLPTVVDNTATSLSITQAQARAGTFFLNTYAGTKTFVLPAAEAGMAVCIKNGQGVAQVLRVDTDGTDYIVMSTGARTSAAGDYYGATASASNQICLACFDATDWYVTSTVGTWTEE
jgi:hypothetical protein